MITPDFVGLTIAVHNGNKFIPVGRDREYGKSNWENSLQREPSVVTKKVRSNYELSPSLRAMGKRKRLRAEEMKEARKTQYFASLKNCSNISTKNENGCRPGSWNGRWIKHFIR